MCNEYKHRFSGTETRGNQDSDVADANQALQKIRRGRKVCMETAALRQTQWRVENTKIEENGPLNTHSESFR